MGFLKSVYVHKIRFAIVVVIVYFITAMLYAFRECDKLDEYKQILKENCPDKFDKKEFQALKNDAVLGGMCFLIVVGAYIGLIFLHLKNEKTPEVVEKMVEWHKDTLKRRAIKFAFFALFAFPVVGLVPCCLLV